MSLSKFNLIAHYIDFATNSFLHDRAKEEIVQDLIQKGIARVYAEYIVNQAESSVRKRLHDIFKSAKDQAKYFLSTIQQKMSENSKSKLGVVGVSLVWILIVVEAIFFGSFFIPGYIVNGLRGLELEPRKKIQSTY